MIKVLIVSPHFPPSNAPDMQRVRLVLPYLAEAGGSAEVLCVDSGCVASPVDPWLSKGLPPEVPVHRVSGLGLQWSRVPGMGSVTARAKRALARRGDAILSDGGFNLVYFSTTAFGIHTLGPRWQRKFRVPFVMDYQDPWVTDYYREHPEVVPPGGRLKYAIVDWIARRQEPRVLGCCSGITSVSPAYPVQLAARYPWLATAVRSAGAVSPESSLRFPCLVIPFPGDEADFNRVRTRSMPQAVFNPADGQRHWVYVGVCPPAMKHALKAFFSAYRAHREKSPEALSDVRLHFIGTSYAAAGRGVKIVEPLAAEYGLSDIVAEHTDRIPYSQTLRCLLDADALIVPGSDDPGYTASKIYPYLLARKPLLAVFHEASSVVDLLGRVGGGVSVPFGSDDSVQKTAQAITKAWFASLAWQSPAPLEFEEFHSHTAIAQTQQLSRFFEHVIHTKTNPS